MSSDCATWIIARTMPASRTSLSTWRTNSRSIFSTSTGMCFSRASDE